MMCPSCDSFESKVVDSRQDIERNIIRRRRKCKACGEKWTTIEVDEVLYIEPPSPSDNLVMWDIQNMLKERVKELKKHELEQSNHFISNHWIKTLQQELLDVLIYTETLKQRRSRLQ